MESNFGNEFMAKKKIKGLDSRVNIAVTSYRWGIHDPDGVSIKAVLDGLIKRRILCDDSSKYVQKICYRSKKAQTKEMERTTIEIYTDDERKNLDDPWC